MTNELLAKANDIAAKIEHCQSMIKKANWTQLPDVVIRKSYFSFDGVDGDIVVPESLFKLIGKLVLSEYNQKMIELQNEFDSL